MIPYSEAIQIILNHAINYGTESVSIHNCLNRVLDEAIMSKRDSPPFNRSAMDGYAIRKEDYDNGIRKFEIIETIYAGASYTKELLTNQCYKIMTGASVPHSANAVIRNEDAKETNQFVTFVDISLKHFNNIAKQGEDFVKGKEILQKGKLCNSLVVSALASNGNAHIKVKKTPTVSVISTGNELIPLTNEPNSTQIYDSNKYAIHSFLSAYGIQAINLPIVKDDESALFQSITKALSSEIVIITGGVSAGDADFVPKVLEQLGAKKVFHKVAIKPGKPIWFGTFENNKRIFSLPGNPLSVQVAFKIFIEPYLRKCLELNELPIFQFPLVQEKKKKTNLDEFFLCQIQISDKIQLVPTKMNGSGDILSPVLSHGIGIHAHDREYIGINETCPFIFWNGIEL
ncbi:MAG: molybdopterin molybdotransferase MoeA [Bacteroidota bacterium]|nr:molybdopterin molybdotransferase MoeA [Bacteroidota bacterium]